MPLAANVVWLVCDDSTLLLSCFPDDLLHLHFAESHGSTFLIPIVTPLAPESRSLVNTLRVSLFCEALGCLNCFEFISFIVFAPSYPYMEHVNTHLFVDSLLSTLHWLTASTTTTTG